MKGLVAKKGIMKVIGFGDEKGNFLKGFIDKNVSWKSFADKIV